MAKKLAAAASDEGLIVRAMPGDAVAFCPPMIITESEIDEMFDRFDRALEAFTAQAAAGSAAAE